MGKVKVSTRTIGKYDNAVVAAQNAFQRGRVD